MCLDEFGRYDATGDEELPQYMVYARIRVSVSSKYPDEITEQDVYDAIDPDDIEITDIERI